MTLATASTVIIGGGVMGCSIAYNLAARGMNNVVLPEGISEQSVRLTRDRRCHTLSP